MEARSEYQRAQADRKKARDEKGLGFKPVVKQCPICGLYKCRCESRRMRA